jgi:hypothetical protein
MMFNIKHVANWHAIRANKQKLIHQNNERENANRLPHEYQVGDKVLLLRDQPNKYERPYNGPYVIQKVLTNGTVRLPKDGCSDQYSYHTAPATLQ